MGALFSEILIQSKDVATSLRTFKLQTPSVYYHMSIRTFAINEFAKACRVVQDSAGFRTLVVVAEMDCDPGEIHATHEPRTIFNTTR